jgi:cyclic pyranopterin phosphate synthase
MEGMSEPGRKSKSGIKMVDVGGKRVTLREAVAEGGIIMSLGARKAIEQKKLPKGDALAAAEVAGMLAAKATPNLLPLCHPVAIESAVVQALCDAEFPGVRVRASIRGKARTGFEMEALMAVSVALLTIYDMAKAMDPGMVIGDIAVQSKSGGKSGKWVRKAK